MKNKMSKTTLVIMLAVSLFADGASAFLTFIPGVGQILNPILGFFVALVFWFWFAWIGLGWHGFWGSGTSIAIEIMPFLQVIPPFTLAVLTIYFMNKAEDIPVAGKIASSVGPKKSLSRLKKAT